MFILESAMCITDFLADPWRPGKKIFFLTSPPPPGSLSHPQVQGTWFPRQHRIIISTHARCHRKITPCRIIHAVEREHLLTRKARHKSGRLKFPILSFRMYSTVPSVGTYVWLCPRNSAVAKFPLLIIRNYTNSSEISRSLQARIFISCTSLAVVPC